MTIVYSSYKVGNPKSSDGISEEPWMEISVNGSFVGHGSASGSEIGIQSDEW